MSEVVMRPGTERAPLPPPPAAPSVLRERLGQRRRAVLYGVLAGLVLTALIAIGSRGFHWFDAALIGYAVGSIFALAAATYKYTFWLMRPQTGRYFRRGWQEFFSWENFRHYASLIPTAIVTDLLTQQFIRRRGGDVWEGLYRWVTHQCIFWGVVLSCCITFPLTFGWLRFTQTLNGQYRMWAFGFPLFSFAPYSVFGYVVYHALVFTSLLLVIGLVLAFHRRFHDLARIAVQRFGFDIVPLSLLLSIAVTGLALTADSTFFSGAYYWFLSLTHEAVVVLWLISLPFGKFFHIIERPATVGIELYRRAGEDREQHPCPRCGRAFASHAFVQDLKRTMFDTGQNYTINRPRATSAAADRETATSTLWWQDFCPDCKRVMRGEANMAALGREGNRFL
jgi:hypothetical protein